MPVTGLCEGAAEGGHMHILKWATEHNLLPSSSLGWVAVCQSAARGNHMDAVQWAYGLGRHVWGEPAWYVLGFAAPHADSTVFKWIRAQGCMFDDITVANAAEHGRLDLLKWCYGQPDGCCWPPHLPVYERAATNGEQLVPASTDHRFLHQTSCFEVLQKMLHMLQLKLGCFYCVKDCSNSKP